MQHTPFDCPTCGEHKVRGEVYFDMVYRTEIWWCPQGHSWIRESKKDLQTGVWSSFRLKEPIP